MLEKPRKAFRSQCAGSAWMKRKKTFGMNLTSEASVISERNWLFLSMLVQKVRDILCKGWVDIESLVLSVVLHHSYISSISILPHHLTSVLVNGQNDPFATALTPALNISTLKYDHGHLRNWWMEIKFENLGSTTVRAGGTRSAKDSKACQAL